MGNVCIVIYDNNMNWNKMKLNVVQQEKVSPGTNTLLNWETKLCASTIRWRVKIASAGREAPCRCSQTGRRTYCSGCTSLRVILQFPTSCTVSIRPWALFASPSCKEREPALCSDWLCRTTTIWWPAQSASGLHSERLDFLWKSAASGAGRPGSASLRT